MELGIETKVDGEIIEKGKVAIDAKLFSEIVRKLPDNDITLETDDNYRKRLLIIPESFTNAGSEGAYRFWALSANQTHPLFLSIRFGRKSA